MNQSEESSNMIINAHTTSCQLHQRSITSAVHYNRIYSIEFCVWAPIVMQLWWCTAQSAYSPRSGHWTLDTAARKTTNLSWRFPRLTSLASLWGDSIFLRDWCRDSAHCKGSHIPGPPQLSGNVRCLHEKCAAMTSAASAVELETKVHTKVRNHGEGPYRLKAL